MTKLTKRIPVDYIILKAEESTFLAEAVRSYFSKGYEPLGPHQVSMCWNNDGDLLWAEYSQTIVKYEETEN